MTKLCNILDTKTTIDIYDKNAKRKLEDEPTGQKKLSVEEEREYYFDKWIQEDVYKGQEFRLPYIQSNNLNFI